MSTIIDNAFEIFGLDLNGIMCDNILAYLPNVHSIFTTQELSVNPNYDPDYKKPWWELAWNAVVKWFYSVVQWFNDLDIRIKIGVGVALFALACIITAITTLATGGTGTAALIAVGKLFIEFAIGIAAAAAISAVVAAVNGEDIGDAVTNVVADAVFWGGVFLFINAGVNAAKAGIRALNSAKPQSVFKDGVEIRNASRADFTDEAWKEIQSLNHNANGETISNLASGNKIHRGFKSGLIGKETPIPGGGRADYFDKVSNIIYELKPYNSKAIDRGINQLHRYNQALNKASKLVLIGY